MPYKKKNTKRTRKSYRRRVPRAIQAVPSSPYGKSKLMKFRYAEQVTIDPGAGGLIGDYIFNANSMYDPNLTGTGHQPMGFDQWTPFFNHYVVTACKITAHFQQNNLISTNNDDAVVGIYLADDSSLPFTQPISMMEQNKAKWRYTTSRDGKGYASVSHYYDAKRFHGVTNVNDNHELSGVMGNFGTGSSPTETACFHVFAGAQNGANDINPFIVNVIMEFTALLREPKDLTTS